MINDLDMVEITNSIIDFCTEADDSSIKSDAQQALVDFITLPKHSNQLVKILQNIIAKFQNANSSVVKSSLDLLVLVMNALSTSHLQKNHRLLFIGLSTKLMPSTTSPEIFKTAYFALKILVEKINTNAQVSILEMTLTWAQKAINFQLLAISILIAFDEFRLKNICNHMKSCVYDKLNSWITDLSQNKAYNQENDSAKWLPEITSLCLIAYNNSVLRHGTAELADKKTDIFQVEIIFEIFNLIKLCDNKDLTHMYVALLANIVLKHPEILKNFLPKYLHCSFDILEFLSKDESQSHDTSVDLLSKSLKTLLFLSNISELASQDLATAYIKKSLELYTLETTKNASCYFYRVFLLKMIVVIAKSANKDFALTEFCSNMHDFIYPLVAELSNQNSHIKTECQSHMHKLEKILPRELLFSTRLAIESEIKQRRAERSARKAAMAINNPQHFSKHKPASKVPKIED